MGVKQSTVTRWESGKTTPSDDNKVLLAGLLKQDVRQLFPLFAVEKAPA